MNNPWCDDSLSLQKPKAVLGTTSNLPSLSPWAAEDDGFGDWATAGNTPWADTGAEAPQLAPGGDSPGKGSHIAWPSSAATSPGLRPLRSRASSVFRQPSPDPWARDSPWNDVADNLTPVPSRTYVANSDNRFADVPVTSSGLIIQVDEPETIQEIQGDTLDGEETTHEPGDDTGDKSQLKIISEPHETVADSVIEPELHESPSRPSSAFSTESERGPDRQDSPITSIDEEPKSRPQLVSRKVSGKVIELVSLYDGLARAASEEPCEPDRHDSGGVRGQEKSSSQPGNFEDGKNKDFGDLEDVSSEDQDSLKGSAASIASDRSSTPKAKKDDSIPEADAESIEHGSPVLSGTSVSVDQLIEKFGTIEFAVDLTAIDKLFPDALGSDNKADSHDDSDFSDRIIMDSFTTVEERKTWYRVSRYGSMRKHNSGEDENYARVNWKTSQLHTDTIKVVRRWMEEDSFSGKATLGGMKRESVFNWDSSAAPVELEKVFARKLPSTHSRTNSIAPPGHTQTSSIGSLASVLGQRKASGGSVGSHGPISVNTASPVASFGWSSTFAESPSASHTNPTNSSTSSKAPRLYYTPEEAFATPIPRPAPLSKQNPVLQRPVIETQTSDDEDDDWGEMISPAQEIPVANNDLRSHEDPAEKSSKSTKSTKSSFNVVEGQHVFGWQETPATTKLSTNLESVVTTPKQPTNVSFSTEEPHGVIPNTTVTTNADSWAFADFSVFEAAPMAPQLSTIAPQSAKSAPQKPSMPQSIKSTVTATDVSATAKATLGPVSKSKEEEEQARVVQQILQNLPDLSYMMK